MASIASEGLVIGTHCRVDLDVTAAIWLMRQKKKIKKIIFYGGGDEELSNEMGIIWIDRGRGKLDHHRRLKDIETSASLVAKEVGLFEDPIIQKLLKIVEKSDLQGESEPFNLADFTKCLQRNKNLTDEERINYGFKMIDAVMEFERKNLPRDNQWTQRIINDFLKGKQEKPKVFNGYLTCLNNPHFKRTFDLVEILAGIKDKEGDEAAVKFVNHLLQLKYEDSYEAFQRALADLCKARQIKAKGYLIISGRSDEPTFNKAARAQGATIAIQQNTDGHVQWFFNTNKVKDPLIDSIIFMLRLEECLIQNREIPPDLWREGRIEKIPEWYYFKPPKIGNKKPARFIQNGSRTAPDVPTTQIPLELLEEIAVKAVIFQPLDWRRWMTERIALYVYKKAI